MVAMPICTILSCSQLTAYLPVESASEDLYPLPPLRDLLACRHIDTLATNRAWHLFSPSQSLYSKRTGQGFYFSFTCREL